MFPDKIQTARLVLRPVERTDAQALFDAYCQDAEVTRFLTWRPHRSVAETIDYVESYCLAATDWRTYALVSTDSGELLGAFDIRRPRESVVGYGYVLRRSAWGRGLMTEALTAVADWALAQPDIWRIGDVCDCDNVGSMRVMEKAGFIREGRLRRWMLFPNIGDEPRDCYVYSRVT